MQQSTGKIFMGSEEDIEKLEVELNEKLIPLTSESAKEILSKRILNAPLSKYIPVQAQLLEREKQLKRLLDRIDSGIPGEVK